MTQPQAILEPSPLFSSTIYTIRKPEFLADALALSDQMLAAAKAARGVNDTYPMVMSDSMTGKPQVRGLEQFIAESAWAILDSQGYRMDDHMTFVSEFWVQEHFKNSSMDQHVHPYGVVISGFYFLTAPAGGSVVELHDPRAGKVQASLPIKEQNQVRDANNILHVTPEPGLAVFTNSWLPHSFTRNSSNDSVKFIHFNVSVRPAEKPAGPIVV
jgi:uncharacterized protein (TIGR02466 family)